MKGKKNRQLYVAALMLLSAMFTACEIESSDNGRIDGFWHLERVDTLATGGSCDLSGKLLFWSVQMRILNLSDKNYVEKSVNMSFRHSADSLRVFAPLLDDRMNGDPAVDDPELLAPYGINALDESFCVERLTGSRMVLKSEALRLTLKRF